MLPPGLPVMTIAGPMSGSIPPLQLPVRRRRLAELILAAIAGDTGTVLAPESGPEDARPTAPPRAAGARVLVAEDVDINRELICRQLEGLGFHARPARDGNEAVAAAREGGLDLILMDMRMPGLDGISATRQIRELEPTGTRVPIVAITANASEADRRACLDAGMDDHLAKPVRSAELQAVLDRWVEAPPEGVPEPEPVPAKSWPRSLEAGLAELSADLGGDDAVSRLIDRWRDELDARLESLRTAVDQGDDEERERVAHALKGASGLFGSNGLTERCAALEKVADPGGGGPAPR